jgi:glucose/arabinose dehydrogenase
VKTLLDVEPKKAGGQHFGSRLAWLPDGTLLVSVGDGGNAPARVGGNLARENAQRLGLPYGKVLRIRDDGSIPPDNPFVGRPGANPAVYTLGHRNVQGLVVEMPSGRVWATEHGAYGGDELNLLEPGRNYGWPAVTYSRDYGGGTISDERSRPGLVDPRLVWTPCIAPSGLALVTSGKYPGLKGDLLAGGLVGEKIRRIRIDAAGRVTGEEEMRTGERIRDVRQGPDGFVYVLTDESDGRLLRLTPAAPGRG